MVEPAVKALWTPGDAFAVGKFILLPNAGLSGEPNTPGLPNDVAPNLGVVLDVAPNLGIELDIG